MTSREQIFQHWEKEKDSMLDRALNMWVDCILFDDIIMNIRFPIILPFLGLQIDDDNRLQIIEMEYSEDVIKVYGRDVKGKVFDIDEIEMPT